MATKALDYGQIFLYIALLFISFGYLSNSIAQETPIIPVLDAGYDNDDTFIIHVQSADMLEGASILDDGQAREMTINPQPLPVEYWYILDAGDSMVDAYAVVRDALLQHVEKLSPDNMIGIVTVADEIRILEPSNDVDDISLFLDTYQAMPFIDACLASAMSDIFDTPQSADRARMITAITGQVTDNPACDGIESLVHPLEVIVIGQASDTQLTEQARLTNGQVQFTPLLQFTTLFDEMTSNQQDVVYALTLDLNERIESTDLTLMLANGESITQTIEPRGEFIIVETVEEVVNETPQIEVTAEATSIQVTDVPLATSIPQPDSPVEDGLSNTMLIMIGGGAAILVVLIVMGLLLGVGRRSQTEEALQSTDPSVSLSDSTINPDNVAVRLDQTEVVTMREMASQSGATHVADLINATNNISYEIHRPFSVLGRQIGSDILIADDKQISRQHVRFETRDNGSIWIVRLTNNPILVNDVPMENTRQLNEGDLIQLSPNLQVMFIKIPQGAE